MKAAFCHLPDVLFALGGSAGQPHLICREAWEPSSLFCTAERWLKVWKAHSQGTVLLGKQGKHFLFLPYTCLWVTQPLSAKLRPAGPQEPILYQSHSQPWLRSHGQGAHEAALNFRQLAQNPRPSPPNTQVLLLWQAKERDEDLLQNPSLPYDTPLDCAWPPSRENPRNLAISLHARQDCGQEWN